MRIDPSIANWLTNYDQHRQSVIDTIESNPAKHIELLSSGDLCNEVFGDFKPWGSFQAKQKELLGAVTHASVMAMDPELLRDWHHLFHQVSISRYFKEPFFTLLSEEAQSAFTGRFLKSGLPPFEGVTLNDGFRKWFNSLPITDINEGRFTFDQVAWLKASLKPSSFGIIFERLYTLNDLIPEYNLAYELSTELLNAIRSDSDLLDAVIQQNPSVTDWEQHGLSSLSHADQTRVVDLVRVKAPDLLDSLKQIVQITQHLEEEDLLIRQMEKEMLSTNQ
ncbi:MAG: hypothetical protein K1060chlam2_01518 [Chlamydiae bacterium]|nr:hypothetical protein [Chlamydiota bacterium]